MSTSEVSISVPQANAFQQEWSAVAPGWRKWDAQLMAWASAATELILEVAPVRPGMQVLDLASGTGEPALTLAGLVGPEGHVTATDPAPAMLATAAEKARTRGLTNISFQRAAAEELPFAERCVDLVTCRLGVMLFANPAHALQATYRVLKPGGRAVFLAWGPVEQNGFFGAMIGPFAKRGLMPPPPPGVPNQFRFAQPGSLSAMMAAAGFELIEESTRQITMSWPGPVAQWMDSFPDYSPGFRRILAAVPHDQREEAKREVRALAERFFDGQRVNFPAAVVVAAGVR